MFAMTEIHITEMAVPPNALLNHFTNALEEIALIPPVASTLALFHSPFIK